MTNADVNMSLLLSISDVDGLLAHLRMHFKSLLSVDKNSPKLTVQLVN